MKRTIALVFLLAGCDFSPLGLVSDAPPPTVVGTPVVGDPATVATADMAEADQGGSQNADQGNTQEDMGNTQADMGTVGTGNDMDSNSPDAGCKMDDHHKSCDD